MEPDLYLLLAGMGILATTLAVANRIDRRSRKSSPPKLPPPSPPPPILPPLKLSAELLDDGRSPLVLLRWEDPNLTPESIYLVYRTPLFPASQRSKLPRTYIAVRGVKECFDTLFVSSSVPLEYAYVVVAGWKRPGTSSLEPILSSTSNETTVKIGPFHPLLGSLPFQE